MNQSTTTRLAVLFSGGGRTLENLYDCCRSGQLQASIVLAVSSQRQAGGIERCQRLGLPCEVLRPIDFTGRIEDYGRAVFDRIRAVQVDLVCLAGYLNLLPIPDDYLGRVLNIHPALLPEFGGKGMYGHHVHDAVLQSGQRESGCTVHFADNQYDHGPIIVQRRIPIEPDDTPDTLAVRVFEQECLAYPEAIRLVQSGEVHYP